MEASSAIILHLVMAKPLTNVLKERAPKAPKEV
jgi:hypothetical protein